MVKQIRKQQIWPCIRDFNTFLSRSREAHQAAGLRAGINAAIIFYSACYLEGVMETGLKALLRYRREVYNKIEMPEFEIRKTTNLLFNALEEDMEVRIARATGMNAYDDLFGLLTSERISQQEQVEPVWEGAQVLFQFRNVLAHGREISASRLYAHWIDGPWREEYSGGYKRAEEYLLKLGLIERRFMDSDSVNLYFTDEIADHFWQLAQDLIRRVIDSLNPNDREAFTAALAAGDNAEEDKGA